MIAYIAMPVLMQEIVDFLILKKMLASVNTLKTKLTLWKLIIDAKLVREAKAKSMNVVMYIVKFIKVFLTKMLFAVMGKGDNMKRAIVKFKRKLNPGLHKTPTTEFDNVQSLESQANLQLQEWKERLGLQDWKIKLLPNCKPDEMTLENCVGCTDWTESGKTARIEILDEKYYGERIVAFDFEKTLVHELLHLKLCLVSSNVDDLQERYMHQIIDDLARAFVDSKRSEK